MRDRVLPWLHFPVVVTLTFALFAWLLALDIPLILATYLPVLLAASLVTALEAWFPHRLD